jgi:hypothetical protein
MPASTLRRAVGTAAIRTGTLRSRWGDTLLFTLKAHSLFRFRGARFQGSGSGLYREGVLVRGSLSGDRLSFVAMAPQPGIEDYLFVAGGGALFKVAANGATSQWGIDPPTIEPVAAVGAAGVLNGTYQYAITFKNGTTGSRSNPDPAAFTAPITVAPANQQVSLTVIPTSSDPQVTLVEIWRTSANLAQLFKLTEIPNGTGSYTDNAPDTALQPELLPFDNARPSDTFGTAAGPYQGRMFWARDSRDGQQGRIFFSPVGRPESLAGFIEVNNGDDPVVALVTWGGGPPYGWTNGRVIQVLGTTEPFTWREVYGAPGTTQPFTVTPSPAGVFYTAVDGERVFDGTSSVLVGWDALARLFHGEALEDIPAFTAVVSAYNGIELWISDPDTNTVLILDVRSSSWRVIQKNVSALFYEPDTQELIGSGDDGTVMLDQHNVLTDHGASIPLRVETPGVMTDDVVAGLVQRIYLDVNTAGALVTPTIVIDDAEYGLPPFVTTERPLPPVEVAVGRWGRVISVRLEANVSATVEVFGIEMDVYVPAMATA